MKIYLRQLLRRYMCVIGWHAWGALVIRQLGLFTGEARRTCERCGKTKETRL